MQTKSYAQEAKSKVHKGQPVLLNTMTFERSKDSNNKSDRFGLFGGYDLLRHIVEFRTIGNFPSCCPGYNQKTDGNGFATGLFYQLSFGDLLSFEDNLQLRVAYRTIGADFSQEEYLGRVRNSNDSGLVDAYSLHTFKSKSSFLSFEPRFSIKPMKLPLHISVGVELGYAIGDMKFSQNEQLIRPAGLVFKGTDSSTSRNTFTDSIIDKSQRNAFIIPGITLGLGIDIPLSSAIKLSPEVTYYLPLTLQQSSLLKPINLISTTVNTPWRFGNLRLGASLSIALSSNKEVDVYDIYQRKDTTTKNVNKEEKESIVLDYTKIDTVAAADKNHFLVTVVEHYTHNKPISTLISSDSWERKVIAETKTEYSDLFEYDSTVHIGISRYDTAYSLKTITAFDQYIYYKPLNIRRPDTTYTLDNIVYRVFITSDTLSKEEKGRIKDSLYITSSKSDDPKKIKDRNIVIVNTYIKYMRLTPCKVETCQPYFAWDPFDCRCNEKVSPHKIVLDFKDANGKAVPDTIFTTIGRDMKIRYIYPAVFFIYSSDESLPNYDKMPPREKIFPSNNYFDNQLLPLNVVALRAQIASGKDTIVLIGYDDDKIGDSKKGKDLGKERALKLSSYLTKSREPDKGPGISPNNVFSYSHNDEKFTKKKKYRLPGDVIPDFFKPDVNSGKLLRSRVEIYGPASTLLKADEGDKKETTEPQEIILSPYSIDVRAIPGNNNASLTKGSIGIKLSNVDSPNTNSNIGKKSTHNFIDSTTALRTILLRGNQPRKSKVITIEVNFPDTTKPESDGFDKKPIFQKLLTPSERKARGFVDTMTTEISFMLPFFCDNATPDDATEPPTQYEKRVVNEIKARIQPNSLVEIQYSRLTPDTKVKRLIELLAATNVKRTERPLKDPKKALDTYNANDFIWEGRFKLTIRTPD